MTFPDSLVSRIRDTALPRAWSADPAPRKLRTLGDQWATGLRTAVLAVPSAVVAGEWNYLLNPTHTDFRKIKSGKVEPFHFDSRLAK